MSVHTGRKPDVLMYKCVRNGGLRYLNGILGAVAANLEKELEGVETVYSIARRTFKRYSLGEHYPRKWYNLLLDIKEIYKGE